MFAGFSQQSGLDTKLKCEVVEADGQGVTLRNSIGLKFKIQLDRYDGNVYRQEKIKVAKGDILEWRKNSGTELNRDTGMVLAVSDHEVVIQGSDKKTRVNARQPQHLDYGLFVPLTLLKVRLQIGFLP